MKHLKSYKLFENLQNEELLEIKDIFQDVVDEWDIYWVDEIDWSGMMSSLYKNKDYFVYNVRQVVGNKDWQYLIDIILPQNKEHKVWKNLKKFIYIYVMRFLQLFEDFQKYDDVLMIFDFDDTIVDSPRFEELAIKYLRENEIGRAHV